MFYFSPQQVIRIIFIARISTVILVVDSRATVDLPTMHGKLQAGLRFEFEVLTTEKEHKHQVHLQSKV